MCFIFLFRRRGSNGGLQVLLCHIQAIIRNAKLHIDCEFMPSLFWRGALSVPVSFWGRKWITKKKNVGKIKTVSTLRSGRVCTTATRCCYSHTV